MSTGTVVEEVKQEIVKIAEEVKAEVVKAVQELSAEEKLGIREIENSYLKAQVEITRLSQITSKAQSDFTATVEQLTKRYAIDPSVWIFDNVKLQFTRK